MLKRISLFLFVFTFATSCIFAYKYELSIAAIFQNEGSYLKEWIEYHKLLGVEHFYLYNNASTDNFADVLAPYIDNGEVELTDWSYTYNGQHEWTKVQSDAYNDALQKAKKISRWLAIIDIDEFIVPIEKDNIVDFLKNYKVFGGVCIHWKFYGTSWINKLPTDQLLIENLVLRQIDKPNDNQYVKSIVQPTRVLNCTDPHYCHYRKPYYQVDIDRKHFKGSITPFTKKSTIRINHYWTRDENWFVNEKVSRLIRYGNNPEKYNQEWYQSLYQKLNAVEDKAIFKYVPALRQKMYGE